MKKFIERGLDLTIYLILFASSFLLFFVEKGQLDMRPDHALQFRLISLFFEVLLVLPMDALRRRWFRKWRTRFWSNVVAFLICITIPYMLRLVVFYYQGWYDCDLFVRYIFLTVITWPIFGYFIPQFKDWLKYHIVPILKKKINQKGLV